MSTETVEKPKKKKRGIAFSGGGSLGAWHVGVLKHKLLEEGVSYDAYAGVSAGALVAAFISQYSDDEKEVAITELERVLFSITQGKIFKFWNPFVDLLDPMTEFAPHKAFVNSAPLKALVQRSFSPGRVIASGKELRIGATSLSSGEFHVFTERFNHLHDAVYASAAIPGAFLPGTVGHETGLWVDGGIRAMTPVQALVDAGCTEIDVCICFPGTSFERHEKDGYGDNVFSLLLRSVMILKDKILWGDFRRAAKSITLLDNGITINVIAPDANLSYNLLGFDNEKMRIYADAGYQKAMEVFHAKEKGRKA